MLKADLLDWKDIAGGVPPCFFKTSFFYSTNPIFMR